MYVLSSTAIAALTDARLSKVGQRGCAFLINLPPLPHQFPVRWHFCPESSQDAKFFSESWVRCRLPFFFGDCVLPAGTRLFGASGATVLVVKAARHLFPVPLARMAVMVFIPITLDVPRVYQNYPNAMLRHHLIQRHPVHTGRCHRVDPAGKRTPHSHPLKIRGPRLLIVASPPATREREKWGRGRWTYKKASPVSRRGPWFIAKSRYVRT